MKNDKTCIAAPNIPNNINVFVLLVDINMLPEQLRIDWIIPVGANQSKILDVIAQLGPKAIVMNGVLKNTNPSIKGIVIIEIINIVFKYISLISFKSSWFLLNIGYSDLDAINVKLWSGNNIIL
ncbi:hypothetical protein BvCmsSINP021_04315 [Escherichia coli]|nr:hypothetical protein BvCmsSINP021_04315 [Escherichia coli]